MLLFEHIAKLIRSKRINHSKGYSQSELSNLLGYKNGQFISNVERALCNIPLKMLGKVSEILDIPAEDLKNSYFKRPTKYYLANYFKKATNASLLYLVPELHNSDESTNEARKSIVS